MPGHSFSLFKQRVWVPEAHSTGNRSDPDCCRAFPLRHGLAWNDAHRDLPGRTRIRSSLGDRAGCCRWTLRRETLRRHVQFSLTSEPHGIAHLLRSHYQHPVWLRSRETSSPASGHGVAVSKIVSEYGISYRWITEVWRGRLLLCQLVDNVRALHCWSRVEPHRCPQNQTGLCWPLSACPNMKFSWIEDTAKPSCCCSMYNIISFVEKNLHIMACTQIYDYLQIDYWPLFLLFIWCIRIWNSFLKYTWTIGYSYKYHWLL